VPSKPQSLPLLALTLSALVASAGCTGDTKDDSAADDTATAFDPCAGDGTSSMTLGYPLLGSFDPISDGDSVGLEVAPQGGFGVSISGMTTGIPSADDGVAVDVLLETYLDGELSASFLNTETGLYCQGDGTSLFWGVVVGFDEDKYKTTNLTELDGKIADLRVVVTDADGNEAEGELSVVVTVSR